MSEVKLKSGKTVKIDVSDLTTKEWRDFISESGDTDAEDLAIKKCTGLSQAEIESLPIRELRSIVVQIVKATQEPLAVPN
jgi:hypothetical protein